MTAAQAGIISITQIVKSSPSGQIIISVTPDMARELLAINLDNNRNVSMRHAKAIATEITGGRWIYDGSPIKINKSGKMFDGQHRCHAVTIADKPAEIMIVWGLDDAAFAVTDTNRVRSGADVLSISGEKNASALASIARLAYSWDWEDGLDTVCVSQKFSNQLTLSLVDADPDLRKWASFSVSCRDLRVIAPPAIIGFCGWLLAKIDESDANAFLSSIASGANLPAGDPRLALIKAATRNVIHGLDSKEERIALIIKAWNLWRADQPCRLLRWTPSTEKFPIPH